MIEVPDEKHPDESDSVLLMKRLNFPVSVAEWILEESGDVLESSPFLGHISGLSGGLNELSEITISLLGKSSIIQYFRDHINFGEQRSRGVLTFRSCRLFR